MKWFIYAHYETLHHKLPFYIGLGSTSKRWYEIANRNELWRKIAKKNKGFISKKLFINLTAEHAINKEKELIKKYGRIDLGTGCLVNFTSGGQGGSPNAETRYRIGSANRGRKFSDEHRAKLSRAKIGKSPPNKGKPMSEDQKLKLSKIGMGRIISLETRIKLSLASKGRKMSEDFKKKVSLRMTGSGNHRFGVKASLETRLKMSSNNKGDKNPMYGKKLSRASRLKISKAKIKYYKDKRLASRLNLKYK